MIRAKGFRKLDGHVFDSVCRYVVHEEHFQLPAAWNVRARCEPTFENEQSAPLERLMKLETPGELQKQQQQQQLWKLMEKFRLAEFCRPVSRGWERRVHEKGCPVLVADVQEFA